MIVAVISGEWGPVGVWVGAAATFLVGIVALSVAFGAFERFRAPKLRVTFSPIQPWCRTNIHPVDGEVLWVRIGVENVGKQPARGCVGRLVEVVSDGTPRSDVDPVQLRWAAVPQSTSFAPLDIRLGQREFLNVLCLHVGSRWRLVTFEDPDFDPGFPTELPTDHRHVLRVAIFSDNAHAVTCDLAAVVSNDHRDISLELLGVSTV